ncbi:GntR family transcriptional regulator [Croceicoccus sp. Ery15]|uniref:GntR family transcriptional regulator n=1 Tax=Croceicoccus sp. Ery15 TaxID=1703338 RepID=UPI001E4C0FE9|nr:GntR family transcriptional regulator [Croceicoccus sp. Ery15]
MKKASDQAYRILREKILSGELPPGHQLKEEELADLCRVSRTPVREAIRQLETELFVRRSDSQRSYVAEWTEADVAEVFVLRGMLESHAARLAAGRINADTIAELKQVNEEMRAVVTAEILDDEAFLALNERFHSLILHASASERLAGLLGRLVLQPVVHLTALAYEREQVNRSLSEHLEITEALERGDTEWAEALMTAHIRRAYNARRKHAA